VKQTIENNNNETKVMQLNMTYTFISH